MQNKLTGFSQNLRKNMTKEEKHLWYDYLKQLPVTVNRQKAIGEYIVDFYVSKARIVIELDGSQHYSEAGEQRDRERDDYFRKFGVKVLRYTNSQIHKEFENVCNDIGRRIESPMKGKRLFV